MCLSKEAPRSRGETKDAEAGGQKSHKNFGTRERGEKASKEMKRSNSISAKNDIERKLKRLVASSRDRAADEAKPYPGLRRECLGENRNEYYYYGGLNSF